jgi:hypothetical protein
MYKFPDSYGHPKLNQGDINHLKRSITWNETEAAEESLLKRRNTGHDGFFAEFYQTF